MSVDWSGLEELGLRVRPIVSWPGTVTPHDARRASPFSAPFRSTVQDLTRELRQLGARESFLQLALRENDVRNDGFPKARAPLAHPGVIVTLRAGALRGSPQLSYAADAFYSWQDNLRGIALGMEAQRLLKRYGIAQDDQQYRGYQALPQVASQSPEEARLLLARTAELDGATERLDDKTLFRTAAKRAQHDEGLMNAVMNAGRTLGAVT